MENEPIVVPLNCLSNKEAINKSATITKPSYNLESVALQTSLSAKAIKHIVTDTVDTVTATSFALLLINRSILEDDSESSSSPLIGDFLTGVDTATLLIKKTLKSIVLGHDELELTLLSTNTKHQIAALSKEIIDCLECITNTFMPISKILGNLVGKDDALTTPLRFITINTSLPLTPFTTISDDVIPKLSNAASNLYMIVKTIENQDVSREADPFSL